MGAEAFAAAPEEEEEEEEEDDDDDDDGGGGDAEGESLGSHPLTSNRISAPAGMSSVATSHSRWRTRSVHCGRSDGHTSRRAFGAALEGAAKIAGAIGPLKDECSHSPSTKVCELGTVRVASEG